MKKLFIAAIALGLSINANANTVDLKFVGINTTVGAGVSVNGNTINTSIGSYNLQENGGSSFAGFCVDPFQWASSNFHAYEKSSLDASDFTSDGATRFSNTQKLFDHAYGTLGSAEETAGFHLALWEIFHDDLNVTSGIIQGLSSSNSGMLSYATGFLVNLSGWNVTNTYDITFYDSPDYQNFITASPSQVPLPAALPMFLSGIAGLGIMRRRKTVA